MSIVLSNFVNVTMYCYMHLLCIYNYYMYSWMYVTGCSTCRSYVYTRQVLTKPQNYIYVYVWCILWHILRSHSCGTLIKAILYPFVSVYCCIATVLLNYTGSLLYGTREHVRWCPIIRSSVTMPSTSVVVTSELELWVQQCWVWYQSFSTYSEFIKNINSYYLL